MLAVLGNWWCKKFEERKLTPHAQKKGTLKELMPNGTGLGL